MFFLFLFAVSIPETRGSEQQLKNPLWKAIDLWSAKLPGGLTSACFVQRMNGTVVCFVCVDKKLMTLD